MYNYFECENKYRGAWLGMKIAIVEIIMFCQKVLEYTPDDTIAHRYSSIDMYFIRGCFEAMWEQNYKNESLQEKNSFLIYCFTKWTEEKFIGYSQVSEDQIHQWGLEVFNTTNEGLEFNHDLRRVVNESLNICLRNESDAIDQLKSKLDELYKDQSIQFDSRVKSFFKNLFN